jgi:protein-disulfide isomerase
MRLSPLALTGALVLSLALAGCGKDDDGAFGARVRTYLLAHPEVLKEAQQAYYAKQEADAVALARPLIKKHSSEIFSDPRDPFVGPKNAKVTVVQFFDYRCPHCKAEAAPGVMAMMKKYPDVKFVFKELPIFGGTSQLAARTALSVWRENPGDYLTVYRTMMDDQTLDESVNDPAGAAKIKDAIDGVVKANGLDVAATEKLGASDDVSKQLADVQRLAAELGVEGTPGFVIGDTLVRGADMEQVDKLIAKARGG